MKIPQNIKSFNLDEFDFNDTDKVKALFGQLLNFIELQAKTIEKLEQQNEQLKDEIQRLKGEKGKPSFKPNIPNYDVRPGFRKATKKWKKKGEERKLDTFEQAIITIGSRYQLISDFIITENPHAGESPFLKEAIERVSDLYDNIDLWSADAGYISRENASAIGSIGAVPRIYPKTFDTFKAKGSPEWKKMHYDFIRNPQEWLREYHKRSLSETVNSTYLRMFPKPLARRIRSRRMLSAFTRACDYNIKRLVYLKYLENLEIDLETT